jgi:uncharacterized protein (TIGR00251 family)
MSAGFIQEQAGRVLLSVRVQPRASQTGIGEAMGAELKVRVAAPPVDDAANEALVRFLAKSLGCGRGQVSVVRGGKSRHKVVAVEGVKGADVLARLGLAGNG